MKHFGNLVFIALLFIHTSYAQQVIRVYILAGQSNMSGTTNPLVSQLPASLLDSVPNVLIKVDEHKVNYNWGPLRPGLGATESNFGPEISFGRDALDYFGG